MFWNGIVQAVRQNKIKRIRAYVEKKFQEGKIETLSLHIADNGAMQAVFKYDLTEEQQLTVLQIMTTLYPDGNWGFTDIVARDE